MIKRINAAILAIGFSGIIAQIMLLRELLVKFNGNELSIGIILANWLMLEACGAFFIGRRIENLRYKIEAFILTVLIFSLFLPISVFFARIFKNIIGIVPGEGLGIFPMLYTSFFILLPASLAHGALFTFGCKIAAEIRKSQPTIESKAKAIGKVYILETLGTVFGAVIFTCLLLSNLCSFRIAIGAGFINIGICLLFLSTFFKQNQKGALTGICLIFFVMFGYLTASPVTERIHLRSIDMQWPNQKVIFSENSIYGNVTVTQQYEQNTFYSDGLPVFSSPVPDITAVEEFAHLTLLSHPEPENVLIISGGAGGLIKEILKHNVKEIDYTEIDPLILKAAKRFSAAVARAELEDARVNTIYTDGRFFLKGTTKRYDLIMLGLTAPSDLQSNRLFTQQFFRLAKKRLKKDGMLALRLPGSLTYLSDELKRLNVSILKTLKSIFTDVKVIPGDINIIIASDIKAAPLKESSLIKRLRLRGIEARLITPFYIKYKLDKTRLEWFYESTKDKDAKINKDFYPVGVYYSLSHWNALFSDYLKDAFNWFGRIDMQLILFLIFAFFVLIFVIQIKYKGILKISIPYAIIVTGFCGMLFDLVLIFAFQVLYGYVYYWIGLLIAAFMVGAAFGALYITSILDKIKKELMLFMGIDAAIIAFTMLLAFIFIKFGSSLEWLNPFLLKGLFLALLFVSGALVGAEFPLASKIYLEKSKNLSGTAGLFDASDLVGGWIGGILGGVVFLPVLGIVNTCIIMIAVKVTAFIMLALSRPQFS